jgi:ribose transport system permease protein
MGEQALTAPTPALAQPGEPSVAPPAGAGGALFRQLLGLRGEGFGTALVILAAWGVLVLASTLNQSDFLSRQTLLSVTFTMAVVGVLAISEGLVAISGGLIDLAIPTELILPAYVVTVLLQDRWNLLLVILVAVAIGAAWGALNAAIIVFGKVNPIIVTLGTNFAGMALLQINIIMGTIPLGSGLAKWGNGTFLGLPNVFWPMLLLILACGYLLPHTRVGRHVIAVGGNPQAAKVRGISLRRVRFGVFMASGMLVSIGAVLFAASEHSFIPNDGVTFLLPAIAASLLAGIGLGGGSGHLWVLFVSVGFLSTVPTSMTFFGLNDLWQLVPPGAILVVAVSIDGYRQMRSRR